MNPNVLSIAGVDPSGGAGIFADLKSFSALGAYGCGVVVALTAQNTRAVTGVELVDPAFVGAQLDTLFDDVRIDAIKIGMLGSAELVRTVAARLRALAGAAPIVLDPVMVAKSGDALLADDAVASLRDELLPLATVITPNLPEAGVLLGEHAPSSLAQMQGAAERLHALLARHDGWVLLKGGHLEGAADDLLFDGRQAQTLSAARIDTPNTHGTGCSLSSAIAARLGHGDTVPEAVATAKRWLTDAIRASGALSVGSGHGPVHHFHAAWR